MYKSRIPCGSTTIPLSGLPLFWYFVPETECNYQLSAEI
jgi:hypothetical protein